jgi:2-polyprenyl-3-methyl-5-hydroxy-6-metoxy-1,4-benzoquinol methylase
MLQKVTILLWVKMRRSTYTESLKSTLLESVVENGRGYHKYGEDQYILPEEKREQDRLDLQHETFRRTLDDSLFIAPIDKYIHEILDLGPGTGIWAIECADKHPEANVVGVDLVRFSLSGFRLIASSLSMIPTLNGRSARRLEETPHGLQSTKTG